MFYLNIFQQPFHCEIEHKLGMTCLTTGPVTCRVRLDRGGYVPGEAINIWATIDNQSQVTIKQTRASLTEVMLSLIKAIAIKDKSKLQSLYQLPKAHHNHNMFIKRSVINFIHLLI